MAFDQCHGSGAGGDLKNNAVPADESSGAATLPRHSGWLHVSSSTCHRFSVQFSVNENGGKRFIGTVTPLYYAGHAFMSELIEVSRRWIFLKCQLNHGLFSTTSWAELLM